MHEHLPEYSTTRQRAPSTWPVRFPSTGSSGSVVEVSSNSIASLSFAQSTRRVITIACVLNVVCVTLASLLLRPGLHLLPGLAGTVSVTTRGTADATPTGQSARNRQRSVKETAVPSWAPGTGCECKVPKKTGNVQRVSLTAEGVSAAELEGRTRVASRAFGRLDRGTA